MSFDVLETGDIHGGSRSALMFPDAKKYAVMNDLQRYILLPYYKKMCEERGPFDMVVLKGDLVDGNNKKEDGVGTWTTKRKLQMENTADLIEMIPLKKTGIVRIIKGSGYHVGHNPDADEDMVTELLARGIKAKYHGEEFISNHNGYRTHFSHFIGGAAMYKSTPLTREMIYAKLNDDLVTTIDKHKKQNVKIDAISRAHIHSYWYVENSETCAYVTPGWKARDAFGRRPGLKWGVEIGWVERKWDSGREPEHKFFVTRLKNQIEEVEV